jgi:pyruvate dehydrogenase E1 component alpha subunit
MTALSEHGVARSPTGPGVDVSKELGADLYHRMRLIRRFEETVVTLVDNNEVAGVTHEYVGQEAVATGVCAALRDDDVITSTHRGHGHIIAKGGEVRFMLAELLGRTTGYNKGRGGSMHIADLGLGIYGANGIVGAGAPMACGAAYRFKRAGEDRVAVPFFGDGAINQGVLHEALNLGAIWTLPVVFVCENNMYAITTPLSEVSKVQPHERAPAYGMPGEVADGMDVQAVYQATRKAVARARAGGGPTFLEFKTYRYVGHYTAERLMKTSYRTAEEIAAWRERDAIETWGRRMIAAGHWTQGELDAANQAVEDLLAEGVAFARQSPLPEVSSALDYMYATTYPDTPARGTE